MTPNSTTLFLLVSALLLQLSKHIEDHVHERHDWRFPSYQGLIKLNEANLDLAIEKMPYLMVMFHLGASRESRRLVPEITKVAKMMRREVHPVPIAEISYDMKMEEYSSRF